MKFSVCQKILSEILKQKSKDVLKGFRHKNEVQQAFKENLIEHKTENEELTEFTENVLFTTFSKSVADKVLIDPKYIEDEVDKINQDLWELIKYYFTNQRDLYAVDDVAKTLTRVRFGESLKGYDEEGNKIIEPSDFLYYYNTGSATRAYRGRDQYGLSKDFKPYYNRITYTSPLAKGLFGKWNWTFADEAKLYVDGDIEPVQIGFYELNISSNEGYLQTKYLLIGQTLSGRILSEQDCKRYFKFAY